MNVTALSRPEKIGLMTFQQVKCQLIYTNKNLPVDTVCIALTFLSTTRKRTQKVNLGTWHQFYIQLLNIVQKINSDESVVLCWWKYRPGKSSFIHSSSCCLSYWDSMFPNRQSPNDLSLCLPFEPSWWFPNRLSGLFNILRSYNMLSCRYWACIEKTSTGLKTSFASFSLWKQ